MSQYEFRSSLGMGTVVKWLIITNVIVFFILNLVLSSFNEALYRNLTYYLALDPHSFRPWQAVSYMFLHRDFLHLLFNMLGLFFFGTTVEEVMGSRSFLRYYLICGACAAPVAWLMTLFSPPMGITLGASGAIFAVLYACYRFYPESQVYLYGILPVKLKFLLLFYVCFSFFSLFNENSQVAHFAHLTGLAAGFAYFRYQTGFNKWLESQQQKRSHREELKDEEIRREVDLILEKISKEGMGALSKAERQLLHDASKRF